MVEITMVIDGGPDATTPTIFDCSNKSLQVGDNLYYVKHSTVGGFSVNNSSMQLIGPGSDVFTTGNNTVVKALLSDDGMMPTTDDFIIFSKNRSVNVTSVPGYYSLVKFKNNSKEHAEIFTAACEIGESSK